MGTFLLKMLNYFLFYLLLLFSLLPMPVLYGLSKLMFFLLYAVFNYRKKVVLKNLQGSLPDTVDTKKVMRQFYLFLSEMFFETIKCLTISKKNLLKRVSCDNTEIMEEYAHENRSVILLSAHYGNWEMLIYALNLLYPHLAIGVGKPLSNQTMNVLLNNKRSKTGMKIINASNIKEEFAKDKDRLTASLFLADQYPGGVKKGYPTTFLNKETDFMYGAEKYAREYNFPVVYADITRVKRGHYNLHLVKITDQPKDTAYGFIMSGYIAFLQKTILRAPQYWLWSHKRWKNIEGFYF
ncbi:MAG: lysophospholipid acyltransferase family protein [Bacteroidota bacterium]